MDKSQRVQIEASLAGMDAPDGSLDRPFLSPTAKIPTLSLVESDGVKAIAWDPSEPLESREACKDMRGILKRFIRLANSGPQAVLRFARRYGPLSLCHLHDLPLSHRPYPGQRDPLCFPLGYEPIERYRAYASEAGSLLLLASDLRRGKQGPLKDWMVVENGYRERYGRPQVKEREAVDWFPLMTDAERKELICFYTKNWLDQAAVEPRLGWDNKPEIKLGASGMFAELARQILFAIGARNGWIPCSECGQPFSPKKRRNPNRDAYCTQCGKRASDRNAQRRRRKKLREE